MKQILTKSTAHPDNTTVVQLTQKFYTSYTPVGSLLYSKSHASIFCLLLNKTSSYFKLVLLEFHFNMILPLRSRSSSWPFPFVLFQLISCSIF